MWNNKQQNPSESSTSQSKGYMKCAVQEDKALKTQQHYLLQACALSLLSSQSIAFGLSKYCAKTGVSGLDIFGLSCTGMCCSGEGKESIG